MKNPQLPTDPPRDRSGERGAALILALMVSLVLLFLGLGLLLQTSLGLQASGTDRWVAKALYAAEAGAMMQIEMIQMGVMAAPAGTTRSFVLADDPDLPGLLKTQFNVNVTTLCESEPRRPAPGFQEGYSVRYFHVRSMASRDVGDLAGLTRAVVELDVEALPYDDEAFEPVGECF